MSGPILTKSGDIRIEYEENPDPKGIGRLVLTNLADASYGGGVTSASLDPTKIDDYVVALTLLQWELAGQPPATVREYIEEREDGRELYDRVSEPRPPSPTDRRTYYDPGPKINPLTIESRAAREQLISEAAEGDPGEADEPPLCPGCRQAYMPNGFCPSCGWTKGGQIR